MQRLATVFGGSGFIGRYVVANLARAGWQVRVAVRRPDEALFLKTAAVVGMVTPVAANVRDRASVARAVAGAEAVVNLVGILHEGGPQKFQAVQAEGAKAIAEEAARGGARHLVQISAIGADANSDSAYARTKAAGEAAVRQAFPTATILRPSIVFGPEDGFFNRFARMTQLSPALPLIGGGRTRFQPIHVGDAVRALAALLERPPIAGATVALVGPETFTFRELLARLLEVLGRRRLILPLPFALAEGLAAGCERLPNPPLTREEVRLLRTDKIAGNLPTPANLGIVARTLREGLPDALRATAR